MVAWVCVRPPWPWWCARFRKAEGTAAAVPSTGSAGALAAEPLRAPAPAPTGAISASGEWSAAARAVYGVRCPACCQDHAVIPTEARMSLLGDQRRAHSRDMRGSTAGCTAVSFSAVVSGWLARRCSPHRTRETSASHRTCTLEIESYLLSKQHNRRTLDFNVSRRAGIVTKGIVTKGVSAGGAGQRATVRVCSGHWVASRGVLLKVLVAGHWRCTCSAKNRPRQP